MTDSHPIPWTMHEIQEATSGKLLCGSRQHPFSRVFIDSRQSSSGGVFVAIIGDVHDGHKFLTDVVARGVQGLVVQRDQAPDLPLSDWEREGIACLAVKDTTRALGDIAAFNRRRSNASVVGITGSNGKTTTRQMAASVVSQQYTTLATAGNFNNQIEHQLIRIILIVNGHIFPPLHPGGLISWRWITFKNMGLVGNDGNHTVIKGILDLSIKIAPSVSGRLFGHT